MIKVTNLVNTDSDENTYKVSLFADSKSEVVPGATIIGLPEGAVLEMGSTCMTADKDFAFLDSTGTWHW